MFHSNKWTLEDAEIAITELQKAIEMEPDFALPYSRLSHIYIYLGNLGKRPIQEVSQKAKEYAQKTIRLDGQAAESHEALANVFFYNEWKWDEAYRSLEKAIELNPSYAAAYLSKAIWFVIHENFDEAIEAMRISIQLDPFSPVGNYGYAAVLLFLGRVRDYSDQLDKILTAERTLYGQNTAYAIASIYAGMDKPDKMYHYLEKSVENKDKSAIYILVYPSFKKYHQDSRFAEIVKKIGLWK